ncbi:MAG: TonB C-terminal domain-containing protein [Thermodesulfobacterium sp.]|nr:TonB C-terminal domain-containing protein [Thermodesulfobacterium sp.]
MFTKYDVFSYFLSVLVNFLFLLIFFSTLNFKISKKDIVKIKLISQENIFSPPSSLSVEKPEPKSMPLEKRTKELNISKRKKEAAKEDKISEEKILKEKLAKIENKVSEKDSEPDYSLSEEEIKELEKKLLAFQKRTHLNNTRTGDHSGETLSIEYLFLIKRKLQNNFEVPIYLRSQKDLYAVVNIELSSEGKILHYDFLKKSSNSEFNKAVEKCLKVSSPLPVNRSLKLIVEFKSEGIGKIE